MRFEDILPAVRTGRFARRAAWDAGVCIGTTDYDMQSGTAANLNRFYRPDKEGSHGSWSYPGIDKDMLADDWELIPEVADAVREGVSHSVLATLSELASQWAKDVPEYWPREKLDRNLSMLAHEGTEAYKTGSVERLRGAIMHGIAALTQIRVAQELEADRNARR